MSVLINTISTQESFIQLVKKALTEYHPLQHQLFVSSDWNGDEQPTDILVLDDESEFNKVVVGCENPNGAEHPVVILISGKEAIADAVTANVCSPINIQYLEKENVTAKALNRCLSHAADLISSRRKLQSDQRHYMSLFEHVQNPAFILNRNWEFVKVNPAFDDFFKSDQPQIVRSRFEEIVKQNEDFERISDELEHHPDQEINQTLLLKSASKSKGVLVRLQLVAIREPDGKGTDDGLEVTGYNGSFQDITEQKFMGDLQKRMDDLAMTYRLARSLAHEIRNPLTNITLALDQLKDEIPENADDEGVEIYFGIINRSVKRVGDLIDHLLHGSEPKQLQLQETDIVSLAREVLQDNDELLKLNRISLQQQFEQDMFSIYLDKEKMRRVIAHLVTNAIEAIGKKEDGCITVGTFREDHQFVIYVQDNGVGIPKEVMAQLFTPFYTSKTKGIGFGLTSTQSILAEHGALMDVESEPNKGSVFSIGFPISVRQQTGT